MKTQLSILSLSLFLAVQANAFTINPARLELSSSGKTMSGVIQVTNESAEEAQVSIYMMARTNDDYGQEMRNEFDIKKHFLILPANLTLKPKSSSSVRVVYIGPKNLESEAGYRLIFAGTKARPLNRMKLGGVSASVDVLLSYAASVWITPPEAKSKVTFQGVKDIGGKTYIVLRNDGKKRSYIPDGTLLISDGKLKEPLRIPAKSVKGLSEPIMADQIRLIELPKDLKADTKTMKVEFGE